MIEVPEPFAASTIAREGGAGRAWIARLPGIVRERCEAWRLTLDGSPEHGYVALVLPVRRGDARLVLKVSWIDQSSEHESVALRAWQGKGAVLLIDAHEASGAMLLERLNARRTLEHVSSEEAIVTAAQLLRRLSIPAPPELRTVREELEQIRANLRSAWEAVGRPFPEMLLERAIELAAMPPRADAPLIVNQDLHYGNVLEGAREPWLAIDPKPLAGDPAFAAAPLLWNRFAELRSRDDLERRIATIANVAELDAEPLRAWSIVRVIDYWLWALGVGLTEDPERCRLLAGWLAPSAAR